ncbi:hypothetical protein [Roseateles amylovorans]|uniref:Uncharacterized protein n=1 Tax=Roseateles amylovorans TaxID=2978473 RepID=A0ABY6AZK0_9BURK|nr:hypothetical protein [Roseateles amylovorans]UXH78601.1 hypothetical protein N4261_01280 [Roseateles amylovorans]
MDSDIDRLTQWMLHSAKEINRLHARLHETFVRRDTDERFREEWKAACAEFHARYNDLAFPGGYEVAFQRIVAGDSDAIEAALCFLECRPYFVRSGYMFKKLLRKARQAPLTTDQALRLAVVQYRQDEWRVLRRARNSAQTFSAADGSPAAAFAH